jgi:7-cyano-7-deazaguanine synthase
MPEVVVILSGGVDSATILAEEVEQRGPAAVAALFCAYGAKHNEAEGRRSEMLAGHYGVLWERCDLSDLRRLLRSTLLLGGDALPLGEYSDETQRQTVVPFRNGVMLAVAVAWAASIGATEVLIGSHAGDQAVYPDCRPAFTAPFSAAATAGTYEGVRVRAPFAGLTKAEIVKRGAARGVPWPYTWSCYAGGEEPCGVCGACYSRAQAFAEAGVPDA